MWPVRERTATNKTGHGAAGLCCTAGSAAGSGRRLAARGVVWKRRTAWYGGGSGGVGRILMLFFVDSGRVIRYDAS
ncbi:MAG: hypothetical protein ACYCYO_21000 [Bacilli bacterium]